MFNSSLGINRNINNIFLCHNSLNKLNTMLIEWCDIMLVENCVFLKYLNPSMKSLQLNTLQKRENLTNSDNGLPLATDQGDKKFEQEPNTEYEDTNKKSSESSSNNDETVS